MNAEVVRRLNTLPLTPSVVLSLDIIPTRGNLWYGATTIALSPPTMCNRQHDHHRRITMSHTLM